MYMCHHSTTSMHVVCSIAKLDNYLLIISFSSDGFAGSILLAIMPLVEKNHSDVV